MEKLLIIRNGALGDTLMLLPAIKQLRNKMDIILAGRHPGIDFLRPWVERYIDTEGSGWHRVFIKGGTGEAGLSFPKVDHVAGFLSDPEGVIMDSLKEILPSASINIFPVFPSPGERVHMALYMAGSLERAGFPINPGKAVADSFKTPLLNESARDKGKDGVILHPGSGSPKKNYSPELWLELIGELKTYLRDTSIGLTLLMGPSERGELSFFRQSLMGTPYSLVFNPGKEELSSLLGRASLYIGHDSGITHLAAMIGTPVIALFKNSSIAHWAPLGPRVKIMEKGKNGTGLMKKLRRVLSQIDCLKMPTS